MAETTTPPPIACSLDATELPARILAWRSLLGRAVERSAIDNGIRLRFAPGIEPAAIAELAERELRCCPFFAFSLHLVSGGTTLEVRAPAEARALINALFEQAALTGCGCATAPPVVELHDTF